MARVLAAGATTRIRCVRMISCACAHAGVDAIRNVDPAWNVQTGGRTVEW